jgi:hypothetical protein
VTYQYYRSVDHAMEVYSTYLGPVSRALEMLDEDNRANLRRDIRAFSGLATGRWTALQQSRASISRLSQPARDVERTTTFRRFALS